MVAQLVRQDDGSYDYVEVDTASKKTVAPDLTEFEAYEGAKKGGEELVSGPSIIKQTEKIQREIPSQVEFDAKTGTFITKKARTVDLEYKPGDVTPESTELTALEKVMNMQPMAGTGDAGLEKAYASMERLQKLAEQKQKFEQYTQLAKTGLDVYNLASGKDINIFTRGGVNPNAGTTPLNFLGTPVGTQGATLGTMGAAGVAGHTVSGMLGGSKKQQKAAAAGAAIGMVGGPIGAVVGGTIGHVIGGTVICTELYRQKLMSKEDCRLSWDFTINNFSKTHINGYWYWAVPMTKIMKKNKLVTKFWNHIMSNRTKDIKWRLGKNKFNLLGRLYSILIENGSYIIGKLIKKKKIKEVLI